MCKLIRVLSRTDFDNFINSYNWINNIPNNIAIIEIFNSDVQEFASNPNAVIDEFNYVNNLSSAKVNGDNVLHLMFDDIVSEKTIKINNIDHNLELFRFHQAKQIIDFIIDHIDCDTWLIHCSAGISRSGAVGTFVFNFLSEFFKTVQFPEKSIVKPNFHVLNMLDNTLDCLECSDKFNDVSIFLTESVKIQLIPWNISNDDVVNDIEKYKSFFINELNLHAIDVNKLINKINTNEYILKFIKEFAFEIAN